MQAFSSIPTSAKLSVSLSSSASVAMKLPACGTATILTMRSYLFCPARLSKTATRMFCQLAPWQQLFSLNGFARNARTTYFLKQETQAIHLVRGLRIRRRSTHSRLSRLGLFTRYVARCAPVLADWASDLTLRNA